MPAIPLGKADSRRVNNAKVGLCNLTFEPDLTNTQDQVSFIARPGLNLWNSPGSNPVRGLFTIGIGTGTFILGAQGNAFFGYTSGGMPALGASGTVDGLSAVTFGAVGNSENIKVALTGGSTLYSYTFGIGLSAVSFPDSAAVASVDALASRLLAVRAGTQQRYWSAPNATTIDPLDFSSAESITDNLVGNAVIGDEEWLFGTKSIEVHVASSNPDLPFQRIVGRQFAIGLLSVAAMAKVSINSSPALFFVGAVERKVFQIAPNPVPVSDPALEARLALASATEINMLGAQANGHTYLVVNMGAQGSMAMDVGTGLWAEWTSFGFTDFQGRFSTAMGDGRYLCGDASGKLHILDPLKYTDNGTPLARRLTGLLSAPKNSRIDTLILGCTVGQAATYPENPVVVMEFSDNLGKTWSDPETASLGHKGEFDTVPLWTRLGAIEGHDGRLFAISCSEDLPLTFHTLTYNERP